MFDCVSIAIEVIPRNYQPELLTDLRMPVFDISEMHQTPTGKEHNIIKVIGVGGGGSNAVSYMYREGKFKGVDFLICNTDTQALKKSSVPNKLVLGEKLTDGLGAGSKPEVGRESALNSEEEIRNAIGEDTQMVFVTAGMGGGTGTGAGPIIAGIAKEMGKLTIGIVTLPFSHEGRIKQEKALLGLAEMRKNCDATLVILNDKLREVFKDFKLSMGYQQVDAILSNSAKNIAEIITLEGEQNIDFQDVKTALKDAKTAMMGTATATGEGKAAQAIEKALSSPLLQNQDIKNAKWVLVTVVCNQEETTFEDVHFIPDYVQEKTGYTAELKLGIYHDPSYTDDMKVTVVVAGFPDPTMPNDPSPSSTSNSGPTSNSAVPTEIKVANVEADVKTTPSPTAEAKVEEEKVSEVFVPKEVTEFEINIPKQNIEAQAKAPEEVQETKSASAPRFEEPKVNSAESENNQQEGIRRRRIAPLTESQGPKQNQEAQGSLQTTSSKEFVYIDIDSNSVTLPGLEPEIKHTTLNDLNALFNTKGLGEKDVEASVRGWNKINQDGLTIGQNPTLANDLKELAKIPAYIRRTYGLGKNPNYEKKKPESFIMPSNTSVNKDGRIVGDNRHLHRDVD